MDKYFSRYLFEPAQTDLTSEVTLTSVYTLYAKIAIRRKIETLLLPSDFFIHLSTYYNPDNKIDNKQFLRDFLDDVTNPKVKDFTTNTKLSDDDTAIFQNLYGKQAFNYNLMGKIAAALPLRIKPHALQDVRSLMKEKWLDTRNKNLNFMKELLHEEFPKLKIRHNKVEAKLTIHGPSEHFFLRKFKYSQLFESKKDDVFNCIFFINVYCDI